MDKRARLIQELGRFSRNNSKDSSSTVHIYDSSDEDLRVENQMSDSEFGDDTESEGEDDLECHLPLLVPEELQDLGVSALRAGNYEAATRYLSLCQLRTSENMGKQLSGGGQVQLSHDEIFRQWAVSTYLQAAITQAPFVELPEMLQLYQGMLVEGSKQAEVSARINEDLAHSELQNCLMEGQAA